MSQCLKLLASALLIGCANADAPSIGDSEATLQLRVCHSLGCYDGLDASFEQPIKKRGQYRLEVLSVNGLAQCDFSVPRARGRLPGCDDRIWLEWNGRAQVDGFWLHDTPAGVRVSIQSDRELSTTHVVGLEYVSAQPNGPECEPTCRIGQTSLAVGEAMSR